MTKLVLFDCIFAALGLHVHVAGTAAIEKNARKLANLAIFTESLKAEAETAGGGSAPRRKQVKGDAQMRSSRMHDYCSTSWKHGRGTDGGQQYMQVLCHEKSRLVFTYGQDVLDRVTRVGADLHLSLGARLTSALHGDRPFIIGVTGGSSTAGKSAWPALLEARLRKHLGGVRIITRNAAQGTTSQLVTAPCIQNLVGAQIDLLLWEFAMNDEYEWLHGECPDCTRRRSAEAYLRQAISIGPAAMGFVHLWDLDIHSWTGALPLPNKSVAPTNQILDSYGVRNHFSASIIDTIWQVNSTNRSQRIDKTLFLRDGHHPNDQGNAIIVDLLVCTW